MKDNEILDLFQEQGLKIAKTSEQLEKLDDLEERFKLQIGVVQDLAERVQRLEDGLVPKVAKLEEENGSTRSSESVSEETHTLHLTRQELRALWQGHAAAWKEGYQYFDLYKNSEYKDVDHLQLSARMEQAMVEVREERNKVVIIIEPEKEGT